MVVVIKTYVYYVVMFHSLLCNLKFTNFLRNILGTKFRVERINAYKV